MQIDASLAACLSARWRASAIAGERRKEALMGGVGERRVWLKAA
jgi:hypothetical protein